MGADYTEFNWNVICYASTPAEVATPSTIENKVFASRWAVEHLI